MIQQQPSSAGCTTTARSLLVFGRQYGMAKTDTTKGATRFRPTFIRQWREKRGMSLSELADRVPMDKGNLSKVERGLLPYNQEMLERLSDALQTEPASLLMRDPTDSEALWTLWDKAKPGVRAQITEVAAAIIRTGTGG